MGLRGRVARGLAFGEFVKLWQWKVLIPFPQKEEEEQSHTIEKTLLITFNTDSSK
jgi:hypothetical protein